MVVSVRIALVSRPPPFRVASVFQPASEPQTYVTTTV